MTGIKHPGGRPTKYKPEYCQQIIEFFDVEPYRTIIETRTYKDGSVRESEKDIANDLPFFEKFAHDIGVTVETLQEWKRVHPEFSLAYKKAKKMQERNWKACSLRGLYNPAFTIFMGKNVYGWTDRQALEVNAKGIEDVLRGLNNDDQ